MRISKYIHSCLLVEDGAEKLLFDPGKFSFVDGQVKPEQFTGITAILLTHVHPDHADQDALREVIANNPSAIVLANRNTQKSLAENQIGAEVFESGERYLGSFRLEAFEAAHASILGSDPPQNTAFLVNRVFLNTGDSFSENFTRMRDVPALALPVMAPWTTELGVAEFAGRVRPAHAIPVHDGYVKQFFLEQRYELLGEQFSELGIQFQPMVSPGDSFELDG